MAFVPLLKRSVQPKSLLPFSVSSKKASIVIPALNEEPTIGAIVMAAKVHGKVIVVNNSSTDKTADVARDAGAEVILQSIRGYEPTLQIGVDYALRDNPNGAIVLLDGDGQFNTDQIPEVLAGLENAHAILARGNVHMRPCEIVGRHIAKFMIGVSTPICGFRAFRADVLKEIGGFIDPIRIFGLTVVIDLIQRGYSISEVNVDVYPRRNGKSRTFDGSAVVAETQMILKILYAFALGVRKHKSYQIA